MRPGESEKTRASPGTIVASSKRRMVMVKGELPKHCADGPMRSLV